MQIKRKIEAIIRNQKIANCETDLYTDNEKSKATEKLEKLEMELESHRESKGFNGDHEGVAGYLKEMNVEIDQKLHWHIGDGSWC